MRIEFLPLEDHDQVVGSAVWDGHRAVLEASEEPVRSSLERIFLASQVVVEDGSFRYLGATGEAVLQPGSLDWFREAALARSKEQGLRARIVPEVQGEGGWDPAAAYRPFREIMKRLTDSKTGRREEPEAQPGEEAPPKRAETGDQPRGSAGPPTGP